MTTEIDYSGVTLEIEYEYEPEDRGDYYNAPEGGNVMIVDIWVEGVSVIDIMDHKIIDELADKLLERELNDEYDPD